MTTNSSNKKVLLDFYADWCGPCKVQKPIIEKFAKENEIELKMINVDEYPELANKYSVRGIPTIVLEENGTVKTTLYGLQSEANLKKLLNN